MNDNIIQTQLTVVAFKAAKVEFNCTESIVESEEILPNFDLVTSDLTFTDNNTHFAKVFHIKLNAANNNERIELNLEYHVVFKSNNEITTEFLDSTFGKISAPAIGFPFVRAFISTLTLQAGIPPILLPSINFMEMGKQNGLDKL